MTNIEAKITSKGQITLPKQVRQQLGVSSGDRVRFELDGQDVRIYPKRSADFSALIGIAPLDTEWDGMSAFEVVEAIRGEPEERADLQAAAPHPNVKVLDRE